MAARRGIPGNVKAARQRLAAGRAQLRELHDAGGTGRTVASGIADMTDAILLSLFDRIATDSGARQRVHDEIAVVLHGGTGRRDMAPYSDIDLMLLCRQTSDHFLTDFAAKFSRSAYDIGFQLGHSVRTPREAWSAAVKNPKDFSSLAEARCLAGNRELYTQFMARLHRISVRSSSTLLRALIEARQAERNQYGESVYVLRPHIKKGEGGLRDAHLLRWLGFVKYGETDVDQLCRKQALSSLDATRLSQAHDYLLRLRNEMHFHAGRPCDELAKHEQLRIAEKFGYPGSQGVLPVEQFMREYFDKTSDIRHVVDQFVGALRSHRILPSVFAPLISRQLEDIYYITPFHVAIAERELELACTQMDKILRLVQLANKYDKQIEQQTWEAIRHAMIEATRVEITPAAYDLFLALFHEPRRVGRAIRKLHELRALEHILPEVAHARNLVQFNDYHHYTVDEHSIRAVEMLAQFQKNKDSLGKIYRSLREKYMLGLALLVHDLGKGFPEDHSEVGRRLARDIGKRLPLDHDEIEDLCVLVHNHLMMSHVAFRRDINDESLVAEFASNVGSVKHLKLLYLLACADIAAVGPGALNPWKLGLLTELYFNAKNVLTGHHGRDGVDQQLELLLEEIGSHVDEPELRRWLVQQARNLPRNYCREIEPAEIARQLLELRDAVGDEVKCWVRARDNKIVDVCIGKREKRRAGIFYRMTGMLGTNGLRILTADIKHLANSLVWYWFRVQDLDFDETPPGRLIEIEKKAKQLASHQGPQKITFRRFHVQDKLVFSPRQRIRIEVDNQTVQMATIIDVFAFRKLGLLYTISRAIFRLGLDVRFARISTYGTRTVNVFYVTDERGNKIHDRKRLEDIRIELLAAACNYLGFELETQEPDAADSDPSPQRPAHREDAPPRADAIPTHPADDL